MTFRVIDKIPHNQEIINKAHLFNHVKLIMQTVLYLICDLWIPLFRTLLTEHRQIREGIIPLRHIVFWKLPLTKYDLDITHICDLVRILQCFLCIWEQRLHLLRRFQIELSFLIAHTIFVIDRLSRLDTEQNIMRLPVLFVDIMGIVRNNHRDAGFFGQPHHAHIDGTLIRDAMILHLQIIIALAKDLQMTQCCFFCFLILLLTQVSRNLTSQACRKCNDTLMVFLQHLHVHTRFIIIALRVATCHDLTEVVVSLVVFCKQNEMVIPVFSLYHLTVKPGTRCHIHLTADDRLDSICLTCLIKFDHAIHRTVVCDCQRIHAKFFCTRNQLLDLCRAVQQTVLRMHM